MDSQKWYQERLRDKGYDINRWHQVRTLVKGNTPLEETSSEKSGTIKKKPQTLLEYEEYQKKWLEDNYKDLNDEQKAALSDYLKQMVENCDFAMRVPSSKLPSIIESYFKNQFETNTSGSTIDFIYRDNATKVLFGSTNALEPRDREKYGYLALKNFVQDYNTSSFPKEDRDYGAVVVRFKKETVLERTTYTAQDSLNVIASKDFIAGQVWDAPTIAGIKTSEAKKMLGAFMSSSDSDAKNPHIMSSKISGVNSYFELQYHGDLLVSDIESVCFNENCDIPEETIQKMKDLGIEVYKVYGDKTTKL